MPSIDQRVEVTFTYPVYFTDGLFQVENPLLARTVSREGSRPPHKVLAVVDGGLLARDADLLDRIAAYANAHPGDLVLVRPPLVVPGGEAAKNDPALVETIHRAIYEVGLDRHAYVMAVGGGAVVDLAGYAAATAHRGIRLLRVPTTVLAQNDAAIGVKNGVNAFGVKNFLGTFAPPFAVLNDFAFLETLDDRDWRAGISEAVKVALIRDAAFFEDLAEHAPALAPPHRDVRQMRALIRRCARLHLAHIATSGDPFERGSSRPLDFGHWAAHQLEQLTGFSLRHGEAVALGIGLDTAYSALAGLLPEAEAERVLDMLSAVGFPLFVPEMAAHLDDPAHPKSLFAGLEAFREHLGGELTIMLLQGIGHGVEVHEVDLNRYRQAVSLLQERHAVTAG